MPRRPIIGAFGGDQQKCAGEKFGAAIAEAGYILLTGGNGDINDPDEIKNATMIGATKEAARNPRVVARLIGILPRAKEDEWDLLPRAPRTSSLLLRTVLSSEERNVINGMTPDVVVIFGGSLGTIAEAAFAKAADKKLIFYNGVDQRNEKSVDRLKRHLSESKHPKNINDYLRKPLSIYPPDVLPIDRSTANLKKLLEETLDRATGSPKEIPTLVAKVKELVAKVAEVPERKAENGMLATSTGFPGLPKAKDINASKNKFEEIVIQISSSDHPEP